jgi:phosphotransferase system enzyme I (PtsI)
MVLLDGSRGSVTVDPDRADAAAAVAASDVAAAAMAGWTGPGATSDGHAVSILANVADGTAARAARQAPVEGVGLFRTELCFLDADTEPSVEAQAAIYAEVFEAFAGQKVVIRTLDAGSDKPLKFINSPEEENPALGVRGFRIIDLDAALVGRQLDAIAVAAEQTGNAPWVMAPMIATPDEARRFAALARERNLHPGVMIEVPAAALLAERILEHVEFLSIGTNDLTQYTMAADRMSSDLATLTDPWQPGERQAGRGVRRGCRRPTVGLRARRTGRDVAVGGRIGGRPGGSQAGFGDPAAVPGRRRGGSDHHGPGGGARRGAGGARLRRVS